MDAIRSTPTPRTTNPKPQAAPVELTPPARKLRLSGRLDPSDRVHAAQQDPGKIIAPIKVPIPGGLFVPQYAPTVVGTKNVYDPAGDCDGDFMSAKFQANNNCYNYACNIATNSFAQPGRKHGIMLDTVTGETVVKAAETDGLIEIGSVR